MYYKYRSLKNSEFFLDILLNNRLYAATYLDLNDPMEGHYLYAAGTLNEEMYAELQNQRMKTKICSLTKNGDNLLMWSHYADGGRGVLLGLDVAGDPVEDVIYRERFPVFFQDCRTGSELFKYKISAWSYEEEARVFTESSYVRIRLREIRLGPKMSRSERSLYTKLIAKLRPDFQKAEVEIGCMNEK